jgi:hypothetical protein
MTPRETFRWHYKIFGVAKINADIARGVLKEISVTLPRRTIEWYVENMLEETTREVRPVPRLPVIDTQYAKSLTVPRINEVIVLAKIERFLNDSNELSAGMDCPGTFAGQILKPKNVSTADIVLIDGNHRVASAYYNGKKSMAGVLLTRDQSEKYLCNEHFG